jgi:hypothetical protein
MTNKEQAAGFGPAAATLAVEGNDVYTDYIINYNPYAGPFCLARLLVNLPVEDTLLQATSEPWQMLGMQLCQAAPNQRLNRLEELLQDHPQGDAIRKAIFEIDPQAPLPEMEIYSNTATHCPPLPAGVQISDPWPQYPTGDFLKAFFQFACKAAPMSDPAFHLSTGLFLLSTAVARRVYVQAGIQQIYPNLYQLIVAPSTIHHKTTAMHVGNALLKQAGLDILLLANRQTPESLISELGTLQPGTYDSWPEDEKQRWVAERAFAAQRGWMPDEASHLLDSFNRDYTAGLLPLVLGLFDCPDREVSQTVGRGRQTVLNAYLTFLGATTPSALGEHIRKNAHWSNGLWARFALVTPEKQIPQWSFFPKGVKVPSDLAKQLNYLAFRALPMPVVTELDNEVQVKPAQALEANLAEGVYQAWEAYSKALGYDLLLQGGVDQRLWPSYGRLYIGAMKVATLLAVGDWASRADRPPHPVIELSHWLQGQAIAETWRASAHRLLADFSTGEERGQEEKLLRILQRAPIEGMTARELGQLAHLKRPIVENNLAELERDGLVERMSNTGRRVVTYQMAGKV